MQDQDYETITSEYGDVNMIFGCVSALHKTKTCKTNVLLTHCVSCVSLFMKNTAFSVLMLLLCHHVYRCHTIKTEHDPLGSIVSSLTLWLCIGKGMRLVKTHW